MKRKLWQLTTLLWTVLIAILIVNVGLIAVFLFSCMGNSYLSPSTFAHGLSATDGIYTMDADLVKQLDEEDVFAFLLDETGAIIWEYGKPDDIPNHFTLQQVASFSRWYLQDYPVQVWQKDDGLFVLAEPQDSVWKYLVTFEMGQLNAIAILLPIMLIANFSVVFIICLKMTKRWQTQREESRTEWIAAVSHDIRTPLSVVLGYAGSLEQDQSLTELQRKQIIQIRCQSQAMAAAITDINLMNRLEYAEKAQEAFSATAVLRDVIVQSINEDSQYRFVIELEENEPMTMLGDATLFARLIQNIIVNAKTHNPQGCEIHVTSQHKQNHHTIRIWDNGKGFSEQQLKQLHMCTRKVPIMKTHGLGLPIVQKIATRHRGKIVFSNAPQGGACIEMKFPAKYR